MPIQISIHHYELLQASSNDLYWYTFWLYTSPWHAVMPVHKFIIMWSPNNALYPYNYWISMSCNYFREDLCRHRGTPIKLTMIKFKWRLVKDGLLFAETWSTSTNKQRDYQDSCWNERFNPICTLNWPWPLLDTNLQLNMQQSFKKLKYQNK